MSIGVASGGLESWGSYRTSVTDYPGPLPSQQFWLRHC